MVNMLAYKADYDAAPEEIKVLDVSVRAERNRQVPDAGNEKSSQIRVNRRNQALELLIGLV